MTTEPHTHATAHESPSNGLGVLVLGGVVGFIWYALPDYVPSKRRRALLKALLLVPPSAYGARIAPRTPVKSEPKGIPVRSGSYLDARPSDGEVTRTQVFPDTGPSLSPPWPENRWRQQLGAMVAGVTALTVGTIAFERSVYRIGEKLARRGVSRPHTKVAVVMNAVGIPLTTFVRAQVAHARR